VANLTVPTKENRSKSVPRSILLGEKERMSFVIRIIKTQVTLNIFWPSCVRVQSLRNIYFYNLFLNTFQAFSSSGMTKNIKVSEQIPEGPKGQKYFHGLCHTFLNCISVDPISVFTPAEP